MIIELPLDDGGYQGLIAHWQCVADVMHDQVPLLEPDAYKQYL